MKDHIGFLAGKPCYEFIPSLSNSLGIVRNSSFFFFHFYLQWDLLIKGSKCLASCWSVVHLMITAVGCILDLWLRKGEKKKKKVSELEWVKNWEKMITKILRLGFQCSSYSWIEMLNSCKPEYIYIIFYFLFFSFSLSCGTAVPATAFLCDLSCWLESIESFGCLAYLMVWWWQKPSASIKVDISRRERESGPRERTTVQTNNGSSSFFYIYSTQQVSATAVSLPSLTPHGCSAPPYERKARGRGAAAAWD